MHTAVKRRKSEPLQFGCHTPVRTPDKKAVKGLHIASLEFAKRFGLTEKQAYRYIRMYEGVAFVEQNYGIIHTLDFNEAVDSVAIYCRRKGGKL